MIHLTDTENHTCWLESEVCSGMLSTDFPVP